MDLIISALHSVEADYFKIPTTYDTKGIVRERAFCYELYHQIRSLMNDDDHLTLNGEIDKHGHIDFDIGDQKNPDFVFHTPGNHIGNTLVIEVKGRLDYPVSTTEQDFKNLLTFTSNYNYKLGIFLLYNHTFEDLVDRLDDRFKYLKKLDGSNSIVVLCIKEAHGEIQQIVLGDED